MQKAKSVEEYLERVPEPARTTLEKVRAVIRSVVPAEATEVISYGIPTFRYRGSLIGFGAFKDHCSLFPMGSSAIEQFREELKGYQVSKGTIHFALDRPLPAPLIKKIVKARIASERKAEVAVDTTSY